MRIAAAVALVLAVAAVAAVAVLQPSPPARFRCLRPVEWTYALQHQRIFGDLCSQRVIG